MFDDAALVLEEIAPEDKTATKSWAHALTSDMAVLCCSHDASLSEGSPSAPGRVLAGAALKATG